MLIYTLPAFIFLLLSFFTDKKNQKFISLFLIIVIIIITGLRWDTGTDWVTYFDWYSRGLIINSNFNWFEWFKLLPHFSLLIIFVSVLFYSGVRQYFIKNTSHLHVAGFVLYYASTIGALGANRHMISIGLLLFALSTQKTYLKYSLYLLSIIAHESALLAFLLFINPELIKKYIKYFFLTVAIITAYLLYIKFDLLQFIFINSDLYEVNKLNVYAGNMLEGKDRVESGIFGVIKRVVFLIIFYINRNILDHKKLWFYLFMCFIYLAFKDVIPVVVSRGVAFLGFIEIELLIICLLNSKNRLKRFWSVIILIYFFIVIYKSISIFKDEFIPYTFII
tara:strand:- start:197 stop:1204 length:1008 start_codon:yes stop_codon:yes gene_type:complete